MKNKFRPYAYLYHAESDSCIKVYSEKELEEVFQTSDGGLCCTWEYKRYREWRIQDAILNKIFGSKQK